MKFSCAFVRPRRWLGALVLCFLSSSLTSHAGLGLKVNLSPGGLVAVQQELQDGRRLVLLGVETDSPEFPAAEDLIAQGFKGNLPTAGRFDPSFLILVDKKGVKNIYSFELGAFNEIPESAFQHVVGKHREDRLRQMKAQNEPEKYAALPVRLMNVPRARRNLWLRLLGSGFLMGAQFTPVAPAAAATKLYAKQRDKIRDKQAAFLGQAVDLALHHDLLPELGNVLSTDELEQLGSAIMIRYNMESRWKGLWVDRDERTEFYRKMIAKRDEREVKHRETLQALAREKGLHFSDLGPGFALLSISRQEFKSWLEESRQPGRELTGEQKKLMAIVERYEALPESAGDLIPYRIFALDEKMKNFDVVDFPQPLRNGTYQRVTDFTKAALGMTYVFLDIWPAMALEASVNLVAKVTEWMGYTIFQYRLAAYGRLQANLKLGAVDLYDGEIGGRRIVQEMVLDHARSIGVTEEEVVRMSGELKEAGDEELGHALTYLLNELIEIESRYAAIFETQDLAKIRRVKRIHLQRLENWIKAEKVKLAAPKVRANSRPMHASKVMGGRP